MASEDSPRRFRSIAERMRTHTLGGKYNGYGYSYLLKRGQPLDLLEWRGGDFISDGIRYFSGRATGNDDFSHSGILVTREILPDVVEMKSGRLYVWEATMSYSLGGITDGVPNIETGRGKLGVQIRDLEDVLRAYVADSDDEAMGWCRLLNNPWLKGGGEKRESVAKRRKDIIRRMRQLHEHLTNRPFERSPLAVLGVLIPSTQPLRDCIDNGVHTIYFISDEIIEDVVEFTRGTLRRNGSLSKKLVKRRRDTDERASRHRRSDNSSEKSDIDMELLNRVSSTYLFCSEMVAIIYIELGIMDKSVNPANVLPISMVQDGENRVAERPILIFPQ